MASSVGITPRKQRGLWYYMALRSCGERVFPAVFRASYLGGQKSIKELVITIIRDSAQKGKTQKPLTDEASEKTYKKQFNDEQRHKLDGQRPPEEFDITFLHKLLRNSKICDLDVEDNSWKDPNKPLEHGIQFLKDERNRLSHESQEMSAQDYSANMDNLLRVAEEVLKATGRRFGHDYSQLVDEISQEIRAIQETDIVENMDPSNVDHWHKLKEIQRLFREHEERDAREESMEEITKTYELLCLVEPAPWLLRDGEAVEPDLIYVTMELEQDDAMHGGKEKKKKKVIVNHEKLVTVERPDGTRANLVVLKGDGGLGKSTLMKLVLQNWMNKTSQIEGLESYPLVLFTECRDTSKESVNDLLHHYLPKTVRSVNGVERLKEIVLSQPLIIIVDGYDEVNPSSEKLLKEILALNGEHIKVFVTTRPISAKQLALIVPKTKRSLTLQLMGIDKEHQFQFVYKLLQVLLDDSQKVTEETHGLMKHLRGMAEDVRGILSSPLNLCLIVLIWLEYPEKVDSLTCMTALFTAFRELISGKVTERLVNRGIKESNAEEMGQTFLEYYDELAYATHCRGEFELKEGTVGELKQKCRDVQLAEEAMEEFLSSYFTMKMSRKVLKLILVYSFRHRSEQEYACANYLAKRLTLATPRTLSEEIAEKWSGGDDLGKKFERVLLYLTGILHEGEALDALAPEIVDLIHFETFPYSVETDPLLRHLAECDTNASMAKAVRARLEHFAKVKKSKWRISTGIHLCSLLPLLSSSYVKKLDLYVPEDTTTVTHLLPSLASVVKNDIKLKLELTNNFFKFPSTTANDDSIMRVFSKSENLEEFRGRISEVGIQLLPESVTTLKLAVGVEDIPHLNKRIPDLWELSEMTLVMRPPAIPDPEGVTRLEYYGEELWLWLETSGMMDDQASRAGTFVRNMWPAGEREPYDGVAFFETHLTAAGIEKLLESIADGSVKEKRPSLDSGPADQLQKLDINRSDSTRSDESEQTLDKVVLWVLRIDTSQDISTEDVERLTLIAQSRNIEELHVY